MERLEGLLRDAEDRRLRLAAEYDNFRKRIAKERIELTDRAQAALVTRLLDVIDDLDRLATLDLAQTSADSIHEALVLVDRKLRKELAAAGLERSIRWDSRSTRRNTKRCRSCRRRSRRRITR